MRNPRSPVRSPLFVGCACLLLLLTQRMADNRLNAQVQVDPPLSLDSEPGMYTHIMRWAHGIQPLTSKTLPIAMRANTPNGGYAPETDPFRLRIALINAKQFPAESGLAEDTVFRVEQAKKQFPYDVSLFTPFTRVATLAERARMRYEKYAPSAAKENAAGVEIRVAPQSLAGLQIDRVLVRRGDTIIQPSAGGTVALRTEGTRGAVFSFPVSTFKPNIERLTLVFVGAAATAEWTMLRRELEALR